MEKKTRFLPSYNHEISRLFFFISLVIVVTLFLSYLFYQDSFRFWECPFSDLGNKITPEGTSNWVSRLIFSAGFISCGAMMLNISSIYKRNQHLRNHRIKRWLALLGSIGYFVAITPNDVNHFIHSLGMGAMIGVMYFFTMIFLFELKSQTSTMLFFTQLSILNVGVLTYAVAFFTNSIHKQSTQKLCVFGLILALEKMITVAPERFELEEIFEVIRR